MSEIGHDADEVPQVSGGGDAAVPEPAAVGAMIDDGSYEAPASPHEPLIPAGFVPIFDCSLIERETLDAIAKAGINSTFTKTAIGWDVKFVDGGTILFVQGPSIPEAIGSHGAQREYAYMAPGPIVHPPIEPEPDVAP